MTGGNASARRRWRIALPIAATVALLAPLAYLWQASLVPKHYSVMQMGYADFGVSQSGPSSHSGGHGGSTRSVLRRSSPTRPARRTGSSIWSLRRPS